MLVLCLALAACGGGGGGGNTQTDTNGSVDGVVAPTAPPVVEAEVPEDVPILEEATNMSVTSGGTVIRYEAPGTVEDATKWYQEEMLAAGWEQKSRTDTGFADSITLLRSKPDQNISITIQSIPGSDNVRVQIALSPK
jgi:hypothetical protein